jgi:hypothetical protein
MTATIVVPSVFLNRQGASHSTLTSKSFFKGIYTVLLRTKFSIGWYMNHSQNQVHCLQNIDDTVNPKLHNRVYMAEYQSKAKVRLMKLKLIGVTTNSDHYKC